jgi:hypothetical protein
MAVACVGRWGLFRWDGSVWFVFTDCLENGFLYYETGAGRHRRTKGVGATRGEHGAVTSEYTVQYSNRGKTVFCEVSMVVVACDHHTRFRMTVMNHDYHGNSLYDGRDP